MRCSVDHYCFCDMESHRPLGHGIIEVDQSFVLAEDATDEDREGFFENVEKYLLERIHQAEMKERVEKEPAESDIAVQTKVINVNKTSKHDNQQNLFCWGTFVSDAGGTEKRSFVN